MAFERIIVGMGRMSDPDLCRLVAYKTGEKYTGGNLSLGANLLHMMGIKSGESGKLGYGFDPETKRTYIKKLPAMAENGATFTHKPNDKQMNKLVVTVPTSLRERLLKTLRNGDTRYSQQFKLKAVRIDREDWFELVPSN